MKLTLVWFFVLCLAARLVGQEPETLLSGHGRSGGFGGPTVQVTSIKGQSGALLGGRGGWVIDQRFVIGGAGRGLVGGGIDAPVTGPGGVRLHVTLAYGGLELQYIHRPLKLVHASVGLLAGGGRTSYRNGTTTASSSVFVMEPSALVTLNLTRTIHLSAGGTYRWVHGASLPQLTNEDLSGTTALLGLEFGRY